MATEMLPDAVRLPSGDELIAPVRILDAQGHVVCVVSAEEFRRAHPTHASTSPAANRRRPRVH
jgi:hypothetical protein